MPEHQVSCKHEKCHITWSKDIDQKHLADGVLMRWGKCGCGTKVREFYFEDYADCAIPKKYEDFKAREWRNINDDELGPDD